MGTRSLVAVILVLSAALLPASAAAQDAPQTVVELKLRDGSRLYGAVEREAEDAITFRTVSGTVLDVRRADIGSMKTVRGALVNEEFLPEDPNRTRLFFGPTGRSLPKGQVYFGTYEFLMPFVQVGITDRFSIGGGTPLAFGFGEADRPFWVTPKLQVLDRGRISAAAGVFHMIADGQAGIAYGVVTVSDPAGSLSAGAGMAYDNEGDRAPVVMIGGDRRVRRNLKLITENYMWDGGGVISGGVRFIGERLSADVGLGIPLGIGEFVAVPIVNFVYVF